MKKLLFFAAFLQLFISINAIFAQNKNNETEKKIEKATTLMNKQKYFEAANIFSEILEIQPDNLNVLYNFALCEIFVGRPDIARDHLAIYIKKNDKDADAYNLLGLAFEKSGEINYAKENYNRAINLEKNYYEAYFNRGRCYYLTISENLSYIDSAKKDFAFAKKSKTLNQELYFYSGKLNFELNNFDSAISDFQKIEKYRKNDENDVEFLGLYANSYFRKNNLEKAIFYYSKLLEIDSEDIMALNNRAICYSGLEQSEKAEADRAKINELQTKYGIDPNSVKFRELVSKDSLFKITIPENWRTFVSANETMDIIIFLNPEFKNTINETSIDFDFGGKIVYHKNYFETDENLPISAAIAKRDSVQMIYDEQLKADRNNQELMLSYRESLRKRYNPNEKSAKNLIKGKFVSPETGEEFAIIDYYTLTTSGELIILYLQIPEAEFFKYENLSNFIQESLILLEDK
jgi:tetratricopeptide (TPR) repeat protein